MTQAAPTAAAASRPLWAGPLLAGLCFGLSFGITQRLVSMNVGELIRFGQRFDVQVFPGTSLESLRLRFGAAEGELRGNLEVQQLEPQPEEPKPATEPAAAEVQPTPPEAPSEAPPASVDTLPPPDAPPPTPAAARP